MAERAGDVGENVPRGNVNGPVELQFARGQSKPGTVVKSSDERL